MEKVLFLSSQPEAIYQKVLNVMEKYGRLNLKVQRATIQQLKDGRQDKTVDCPCYNFKCLRGDLTEVEVTGLLTNVEEGIMTFTEMKQEAKCIKGVKEVQRFFIKETGSENWEEVEKR